MDTERCGRLVVVSDDDKFLAKGRLNEKRKGGSRSEGVNIFIVKL